MKWPFVTLRRYTGDVAHLTVRLDQAERDTEYWRKRAEQLIDAALARAGAIHQPTMEARPAQTPLSAAALISSALSVREIDSSKKKVAIAPVQ